MDRIIRLQKEIKLYISTLKVASAAEPADYDLIRRQAAKLVELSNQLEEAIRDLESGEA